MKKKTLWWIIGSLLVLILLLVIFGRGAGNKGTRVAVEQAATHTIIETVTATGKIYPETEVKIAPEVSGEITELNIAEGDSVHRGQVLVKINPSIYASMVNQAAAGVQQSRAGVSSNQGQMEQARAQYDLALNTYNRNKQLYKDKVISQLEFEQAESQFRSAKAAWESAQANIAGGRYGVAAAQASLNQAQANLQKTTIVAPVSGIISQLNVKKGERVVGTAQMAGTDMLIIADMSRLEVRVDVSETDIPKVKLGDTAFIETDAYRNRKFRGVVSKVSVSGQNTGSALQATTSSDQVTNYTVHVWILPESYADISANLGPHGFVFKPGMTAFVEIQTRKERDVLSVPVNAVTTRDWPDSLKNKSHAANTDGVRQLVFVRDPKTNEVHIRDVKTGIQDNNYIQILEGLKPGEEVVTAPYSAVSRLLKNGEKINVVKKESLYEGEKTE